jgi:alpha-N-acetylglucosaminidase
VFARAVGRFARAEPRFRDSETYRLDLVAFRTQVLSNEAYAVSGKLDSALAAGDRAGFEGAADRLLRLGRATDELLDTEPFYRLGTYQAQALRYGETPDEKRTSLQDAMMLITYWGGDDTTSYDVNDYAYKAWAGMMVPYSLRRWEMYFKYQRAILDGKAARAPDFYAWERTWVAEDFATVAAGTR